MTKQHFFPWNAVTPVPRPNQRGGKGTIFQHPLLDKPAEGSAFSAMSVLTLPPGTSLGVHVHENEEEAYVVISGEALCTSEEGEHPMKAGDIAICYQGEKHGIANTGATDLVMAGIITQK